MSRKSAMVWRTQFNLAEKILKIKQKVVDHQTRPPPKLLLRSKNHFDRTDDLKLGK